MILVAGVGGARPTSPTSLSPDISFGGKKAGPGGRQITCRSAGMTWENCYLDPDLEFFAFKFLMRLWGVRLTISLIFTTLAVSSCESDKETSAIKPIIYGAYIHHTPLSEKIPRVPAKTCHSIVSYDNKYFIYDPCHVII